MTENELKTILCTRFLDGDTEFPIALDTDLLEEGICDSLAMVQLAAELQKRLPGVKIKDQEITRDNFGSMRKILALVAKKAQA